MSGLTLACLLSTVLAIAACDGGEHVPMTAETVEWGYDGAGAPENWASLSEEVCGLRRWRAAVAGRYHRI